MSKRQWIELSHQKAYTVAGRIRNKTLFSVVTLSYRKLSWTCEVSLGLEWKDNNQTKNGRQKKKMNSHGYIRLNSSET